MRKTSWHALLLTLSTTIFLSTPILAQDIADQADQTAEDEGAMEEVVITGSRIRQNPLDTRTPVQFHDEGDMDLTSSLSAADYLQKLPITGSAINRLNNSSGNLGFPPDGAGIGAGASEIDLRNLGSKRTLVLVDGRRWIRGSSASGVSGAVDINTIPNNAVKSIEISMDGASAVYGSDAMAGVVNIITQDDYDGFKTSAYYGQFDDGDGESAEFDIRWGTESERSRTLIDLSWTDQKEVTAGERDISEFAIAGFPYGLSSGTPEGRLVFTDPRIGQTLSITSYTQNPFYDPNCWATGSSVAGCDDFQSFTLDDRFNWQPFNYLLTPNKRVSAFAKSEYDITDKTMFRITASFNKRESTSQAAPEPLFFGPDAGAGFILDNLLWPADHPTNPFGIDMGPDSFVFTGRRPIEAGPRVFDQDVTTWLVSAGIDGSFTVGDNLIYWDATAIFSENDASQIKHGAFNAQNISIALGPTDVCDVTPGCVPLNWVGPGTMSQEMLDFVTFVQKDVSDQELFDFTFNLTGEFGGFSAGNIGWAAGFEHREEDGAFTPDSVVSKGFTAGVPASPTAGGFDVDEFYGEVIVPLWQGDGAQRLDVNAAARYSDYDLFSSDTVFSFGANWAPTDNLVFRANFAEGFRAPNIGELFNTGSRFDAGVSDPCSNPAPEDQSNCLALGVPADFVTLNPQTSVTTGGNPNLTPETSDTFTAGFSWDIPLADNWNSVDGFLFEFNYYDIQIDDAIQPPDAQDVLDSCVDTLDPFFCNNVTRTVNGTVTRIDGVLQNIGGIETSGVDWKLELTTADTDLGQFRFQWLSTLLSDYTEIIPDPDGFIDVSREGTELGSPERGFPEYKSTVAVDWMRGNWAARISFRYIDSMDEQCTGSVADFELQEDFCSSGVDGNKIDSSLWTDAQVSWSPEFGNEGQWSFTLGIDNLFEEDIPVCFSCDLNSFDGTMYPIPGRFWYARAVFEID
jgi:iron complex outermembrane receptor protein